MYPLCSDCANCLLFYSLLKRQCWSAPLQGLLAASGSGRELAQLAELCSNVARGIHSWIKAVVDALLLWALWARQKARESFMIDEVGVCVVLKHSKYISAGTLICISSVFSQDLLQTLIPLTHPNAWKPRCQPYSLQLTKTFRDLPCIIEPCQSLTHFLRESMSDVTGSQRSPYMYIMRLLS